MEPCEPVEDAQGRVFVQASARRIRVLDGEVLKEQAVLGIALQIVLTTGINFIIAPLSVFFRDLERIVRLATRLLFYGSPVRYSLNIGHPGLHLVYGFNQMAGILELFRACFFPETLDWLYVWQAALVSMVIFGIGCVVFRRTVPTVLKEI